MPVGSFLRSLKEDVKAKFRGESRVAQRNVRGRVYEKSGQGPEQSGSVLGIRRTPAATLNINVTRADGTVESITVPATVEESPNG